MGLQEEEPFVRPPIVKDTGTTAPPPAANEGLPDPWTVYSVDGQLYIVWEAPVDEQTGRVVPVCWQITAAEFAAFFSESPLTHISRTMTQAQFDAAGCVDAGDWEDLPTDAAAPEHLDFWADPLEGWLDALEEESIIAPYLEDPEVAAIAAAAYVEGTSLSQAQLAGTDWWQSHNAAQRYWLLLHSSDPAQAEVLLEDNRLSVEAWLEQAGVSNADDISLTVNGRAIGLVGWLAQQWTQGQWSQAKVQDQIELLADPVLRAQLDPDLSAALGGGLGEVDTTRDQELYVEQLFRTWLGPLHGIPDEATISRWASRLRQDPDAETSLVEMLQGQRLALFPQYADPTLTYEDVAGPWRNIGYQTWGQLLDEKDPFFINLVRMNDSQEAERALRMEGLKRGIGKVYNSAIDAFGAAFGGPIVRAA